MIKLVLKDLKLFFSNKRDMMLTFALPIIIITVFAYVFGGAGRTNNTSKKYELTISDLDNTAISKAAIDRLNSKNTLLLIPEKLETAQQAVKKGKIDAVLIFHKGFADSLSQGKPLPMELQYDEAKEAKMGMLQQALISTMTGPLSQPEEKVKQPGDSTNMQPGSSKKSMWKRMKTSSASISNPGPGRFSDIKMTKLVQAKEDNSLGLIHAVAGTAIMMLLFSVAGMGASLLDEKKEGTLKKLLCSPMHPNQILYGKMVHVNIISIAQLTIMFVYARLVFGLDIIDHLPSLVLMIFATAYACSSFGIFLASFAKSSQQVQGLSVIIILIMSSIGGSMIPVFAMPDIMQKFSVLSVNYWGVQGFYDIFWRLLPYTDTTFLTKVLVLFGIGTFLNLLALQLYKKNILKIV